MILRGFIKHVTDQNWFAVGLDVLVVIVGIFLGLQVTDWNEERKEKAETRDSLTAMHKDIIVSRNYALEQLKYLERRKTSLERLLSIEGQPQDVPRQNKLDILRVLHKRVFRVHRSDVRNADDTQTL